MAKKSAAPVETETSEAPTSTLTAKETVTLIEQYHAASKAMSEAVSQCKKTMNEAAQKLNEAHGSQWLEYKGQRYQANASRGGTFTLRTPSSQTNVLKLG